MSEWKDEILGNCIETNKQSIGKDYPFSDILYLDTGSITANRIEKLQEYTISNAPSRAKRLVEEEDIIYSSVRPNQLHYGFIKNPKDNLVVSTGFVVISCNKEKILPKYLFYYLSSDNSTEYLHSIAEASTSAYPSLKPSDIEALEIYLPPLPEQKAIASVLSSLDDKIDLLHRQNKTLEQMAETLFRQWFVEEAEDDWKEGVLGDVAENIKKSIKHDTIEKGTKYIALEHIDKRNISLNSFNNADNVQSNKYKFKVNDILFGKLRPYFHKVCFTSFEGVCSTDILVIRPKLKSFFAYCLFAFFQKDVVDFANSGSEGTRMPRTNWNILSNYPILIPPNELILNFNKIVVPIISKIESNQTQIRTLEKMRDTLLPKLMGGEVRVSIDG